MKHNPYYVVNRKKGNDFRRQMAIYDNGSKCKNHTFSKFVFDKVYLRYGKIDTIQKNLHFFSSILPYFFIKASIKCAYKYCESAFSKHDNNIIRIML